MNKKTTLSLVAASLLATNSQALDLDTVTVTSPILQTDEYSSTFITELYTHKDIERSNAKSIYEFLSTQTSISTVPHYGNPFTQQIDLRGYGNTNGYQNIVVTVDGRRFNNIDRNPQLLSSITLNNVEKIEILKGTGSVEFGDGATAGVINIITKGQSSNYVKTYIGNNDSKYTMISLSHATDQVIINASSDYYNTDGIKKDDRYSRNSSVGIQLYPTNSLGLYAKRVFSKMETKYPNALTLDEFHNDIKKDKGFTQQRFSSYATSLGTEYSFNTYLDGEIHYSSEDKLSRYSSGWQSQYDYKSLNSKIKYEKDNVQLVAGVDSFRGDREGASDTTSKNNQGLFFLSNYRLNETVRLSGGIRYEEVDYIYAPNSGSRLEDSEYLYGYDLGVNYQINKHQSIIVNYNKSFQAPIVDNFFSGSSFNRFIKPMHVRTFNVGLHDMRKNNKLKLSLFKSHLTDEIYYYNTGSWLTSYNTNIDKSHKYGLELFDQYKIDENIYTSLNYNYIVAKIDRENEAGGAYNGKDLPGVSKHNVTLNLGYEGDQFSSVVSHKYKSSAYASNDFENNFSQKQKHYNATDISCSYRPSKKIELFANVNNLFDVKNGIWTQDDTIYPVNYSRTYHVGMKVSF